MITDSESIEGFALSAQQEHIWKLQSDVKAEFSSQCLYMLEGNLDMAAFERAINLVVARNEILRTRFRCLGGMEIPLQVVENDSYISISETDLSNQAEEKRASIVDDLYRQFSSEALFLGDRVNGQFRLIKIHDNQFYLILRLPAICADSISLSNIMSEIGRCYRHTFGEEPVAEAGLQYIDYAQWQQDVIEADDASDGLKFWKQDQFRPLPMEWPFHSVADRGSIAFKPDEVSLDLYPAHIDSIRRSLGSQCSIEDTILSVWTAFQWRLTQLDRTQIAIQAAGRKYPELETGIGLYQRNLPLNLQIDDDSTISQVFAQIRSSRTDALRYQDYYSCAVDPDNDAPGQTCRYPIAFDYHRLPTSELMYTDLRMSIARFDVVSDPFLLRLSCVETEGNVSARIVYNSAVMLREHAARTAQLFASFVSGIAANTSLRIGRYSLLDEAEFERLVTQLNRTRSDTDPGLSVHKLIELNAVRTPNAPALLFNDVTVSYCEMNRRADELAHRLRLEGVGPEVLVGICIERSPEMIIGILGILKAGAAYVPLDASYPVERLEYMMDDSGVQLIVTQSSRLAQLEPFGRRLIDLDGIATHSDTLSGQAPDEALDEFDPESLAYVIYTSGSTGRPKGAMLTHRGLSNYLLWAIEAYHVADGEGSPVYSSLGFDLTITGLFTPLIAGRTVTLIPEDTGIEALSTAMNADSNYSLVKITPAHLELLSQQMRAGSTSAGTRAFVIGGEALHADGLKWWRSHAPETEIVNEYGPTETVVGCCVYSARAGECLAGPIPIGRPISNTQLYLLDRTGNLVPEGLPGELYIGGAGVARGYLNQPGLTAERFLPNPFATVSGERMYRTGDICRYVSDGCLEYIGRIDHQVKVRGYRIELGEIETALLSCTSVREAVVDVREDSPGDRRLVAYIVPVAGKDVSTTEIKSQLRDRLPDYMIPSAIVMLDLLPLTVNGKVDRRELPAPDSHRPEMVSSFVEARNSVEELLASIWRDVLRLERVGVHDNFFELGGDSILSIHIIARANQAGLQLTPRQVFQHQSIAALAEVAGTEAQSVNDQKPTTGIVALTPVQRWFFEYESPALHHFNQARLLELNPSIWPPMVSKAAEALAEHHDVFRYRFTPSAEGWRQTHDDSAAGSIFTVVDLSQVEFDKMDSEITSACSDIQSKLNLETGPVVRIAYLDLGPGMQPRLLIAMHHLVMDAVSWRIVLDDLQLGLEQLSRGEKISLPARTTSFQHWSRALVELAESSDVVGEVDYWQSASRTNTDSIPQDTPGGSNRVENRGSIRKALSAEDTRDLLQEVNSAYNTQINDILLAALLATITNWTGLDSITVDLEGHGRDVLDGDVDLSRTVGWFTAQYPIRLERPAGDNVADLIKHVKETLREVPNKGVGYGLLRYVTSNRAVRQRLASLPGSEISFNYLGQMDSTATDGGIFAPAPESCGASFEPKTEWRHLFDVVSLITDNCLHVTWLFSGSIHRSETVDNIASAYLNELRSIIQHCKSMRASGHTPSDFPNARVNQQTLDRLLSGLNKR